MFILFLAGKALPPIPSGCIAWPGAGRWSGRPVIPSGTDSTSALGRLRRLRVDADLCNNLIWQTPALTIQELLDIPSFQSVTSRASELVGEEESADIQTDLVLMSCQQGSGEPGSLRAILLPLMDGPEKGWQRGPLPLYAQGVSRDLKALRSLEETYTLLPSTASLVVISPQRREQAPSFVFSS